MQGKIVPRPFLSVSSALIEGYGNFTESPSVAHAKNAHDIPPPNIQA